MKKIIHDLTLTMPLLITMLTNGYSLDQEWTGDYVIIKDRDGDSDVVSIVPANSTDMSAPAPVDNPVELAPGGIAITNYSMTTMDPQTDIPPLAPLCEYDPGACAGGMPPEIFNPVFYSNGNIIPHDCGGPCSPVPTCPTAGTEMRVTFNATSTGPNLVKLFVEITVGGVFVTPTFPEKNTTASIETYDNSYILHSGYCTTGHSATFMPMATNANGDTGQLPSDLQTGRMPFQCTCP